MIIREWRGRAARSNANSYPKHFRANVIPELRRMPGFLGASLSQRSTDGNIEYMVLTRWTSIDAIRGFAGSDVDRAVVEPEAVAALVDFERSRSALRGHRGRLILHWFSDIWIAGSTSGVRTGGGRYLLDYPLVGMMQRTSSGRHHEMTHQSVRFSVRQSVRECAKFWSEWQDLNLRPPRPERGALPDCATLRYDWCGLIALALQGRKRGH
jgi:heme-degrading monooxygenase HmoA